MRVLKGTKIASLTVAGALLIPLAIATDATAAGGTTIANSTVNDPDLRINKTRGTPVRREDDDDFPWGLLGLLGLAGLLGLKKNDPDVHVDARRSDRP